MEVRAWGWGYSVECQGNTVGYLGKGRVSGETEVLEQG